MRLNGFSWPDGGDSNDYGLKNPKGFRIARPARRTRILVITALGLFWAVVLATVMLVSYGKSTASEKPQIAKVVVEKQAPLEMVEVLVPIQPIEEGRVLEPALFIRVKRPKIGLAADAVVSFDELRGTYARSPLAPHQPITKGALTRDRPANPVIANIPEGHRAVTINVSATSGVEGWARAGAHVDVHWVSDILGERTVTLIVTNAKVLSAERQIDPHSEPGAPVPTTVTLLTSERDAQKISLASTGGSIQLHLRGSADTGKVPGSVTSLTFRDLLGKGSNDGTGNAIEGVATVRGANGKLEQWAVIDGKIMRRQKNR